MEKNVYHITVKNTKTGKVLIDKTGAAAICAAVDDSDAWGCSCASSGCDANAMVNLLYRTLLEINRICREQPELRRLLSDLMRKNRLGSFQKAWYEQEGQE
mgnify:FL=1|nr:MAG TPA: hypothetical protein [Caudoviricetes sp.]